MAIMRSIKKSTILALLAVGIVFAQGNSGWQNLYPTYNGLAFGADKFVAVSGDGLVRTTVDGETWSHYFIGDADGDTRRIYAVAYGEGQFVGVQNKSKYLYSVNGADWASIPSSLPAAAVWKYIAFGTGVYGWAFVAVDTAKYAAWFDEEDWNVSDTKISLSHAASGGKKFVVGGNGIRSSEDGMGWGGSSNAQVSVVAFGQDKFVALAKNGSSVYTSSNGASWESATASAVPAGMTDMVFGGGKFVAVGEKGKGVWSSDGNSWTPFTLNEADDFTAVKHGGSGFLALGAKGSVYKSADGSVWTKKAGSSVISYKQIAYNGSSKYVAVGDTGVAVSSDGKNWEKTYSDKPLAGVAFGAGKFVAVGDGVIISSEDGERWTNHSDIAADAVLTSVAFGGNTFIAGGRTSGQVALSRVAIYKWADGEDWKGYDAGEVFEWNQGEYIASLCFGGGNFLAAVGGAASKLKYCSATGTDIGKYWSNVLDLPADGYNLVSAVYADAKFVALGTKTTGEAVVLSSESANNGWAAIPLQSIRDVKAAAYAKGKYVVAGNFGNIYGYINNAWVSLGRVTNRNLSTIYSGNNVILAAGAGGAMLYSDAEPTSVRYASSPRAASASKGNVMSLDRSGRTSSVTLSFTPGSAGELAVYALNGRRIYRVRLGAGVRSVPLPERMMPNGSVLVRYSGGGRTVSQRFSFVR